MIACSKSRRKDPPLGCVRDARAPAGCQISTAIAAVPTDYAMSAITPNAFPTRLGRWQLVWTRIQSDAAVSPIRAKRSMISNRGAIGVFAECFVDKDLVKHHPVQLPLCLLVEGADPNVADALSHLDWRFPLCVTEIRNRSG